MQFDLPRLGSADLRKPTRFEARVTPLIPSKALLTVDLVIKAGDGPERTARMEADGDRYQLTAVPIPGPNRPSSLRLLARFDEGSLEATTTDRTFTVGGREVALADARTIWPGSSARVSLRDGTTISGVLSRLDAVPMPVGTQTLSVRLDRAKVVEVTPASPVNRVVCTLVVRQGDEEIYRQSRAVDDTGLLKNPGFEDGMEGWKTDIVGARPKTEFDQSIAHEGRQALRVEADSLSDTAFAQDVMLKPRQWYRFSGWVRTRRLDPHGAPVYGTLQVQSQGGRDTIGRGTNHGGDTDWHEVSIEFQAPDGGLTHLCEFFVGFGKGTGTAWFDDLKLEEIDRQGPAGGGTGLLKNPGFEDKIEGWGMMLIGAHPQIGFDQGVVHEGRQSLRRQVRLRFSVAVLAIRQAQAGPVVPVERLGPNAPARSPWPVGLRYAPGSEARGVFHWPGDQSSWRDGLARSLDRLPGAGRWTYQKSARSSANSAKRPARPGSTT